jgi:type III restriction enzyme
MPHLHAILGERVLAWKAAGYPCPAFSAIGEILEYQTDDPPEGSVLRTSRFLRAAQIEALTTYWYLRLVENTPTALELYQSLFPQQSALRQALGLKSELLRNLIEDEGMEAVLSRIRSDADFVAEHGLESLRETVTLDYPSYILALTMGAGKTALIGAIIATEFALALEYPDGPFIENALVFAPGLTILRSLRQLAALPVQHILPPRFYKLYAATVKLIFTRDGDPDIQVVRGDSFNIIITNTEKIRITKETVRKGDIKGLFSESKSEEARSELANRRLQAIASLPHLAVFSDEAHHTYGRGMEASLKRVRQTIDYLHHQSPNLVAVVNTTGTPYLNRQPLLDVVYWYGLRQGIQDGILKSVSGQVHAYTFEAGSLDDFLAAVLDDFFTKYRDVRLPGGARAKLAVYFPQVDDLREARPIIETKLQLLGIPASTVLENTNQSPKAETDAFNRLDEPDSTHRVVLLVNKGTEGWDCPSLFAVALARKLKTSNNFVLQAACRCLRQVPGNPFSASIYLSSDNRKTLEKELQETYGETLNDLQRTNSTSRRAVIRLRKVPLPPLVIRQVIRRVERTAGDRPALHLLRPDPAAEGLLTRQSFDLSESASGILKAQTSSETIATGTDTVDLYTAATRLAAVYRSDFWSLKEQLATLYSDGQVPEPDLAALAQQVEHHSSHYVTVEEQIEVALALVKPDGFDRTTDDQGNEVWTAEISYPVHKEHLLLSWEKFHAENPRDLGFHYSPYNFDSQPEADFFTSLLHQLNLQPDEVEDIYFTGAFTSPNKTDFLIEYRDVDGRWRSYTPDFIIRRKDGRCLIVEIKADNHRTTTDEDFARADRGELSATKEGRKALALRRWTQLNPDRLKYQLVYAGKELVPTATDGALHFAAP